jgi:hypothetical protein
MDLLLTPVLEIIPQIQAQVPPDQSQGIVQFLMDFINGFNLFSVLRTFPLGIFSLMSANLEIVSPLGARVGIGISHWLLAFGSLLVLTVFGWVGGSFYFRAVAKVALQPVQASGFFYSLFQALLLSMFWAIVFAIVNLPLLIFLGLASLLGSYLRIILISILMVPISWVMLAVFFSFHGIFAGTQNLFQSIRSSFRMLRYGLPPLAGFTMLSLLINQGMDILWRIPPADSWMLGVGIFGHAFVSTSLLAASFLYFRDLNSWIEATLQWLKTKNTTSSARA